MKTKKIFIYLFLVISFLFSNILNAQKQIIKHVKFESNHIILNNKKAFDYQKNGNDYSILDLKGNILVSGKISKNENGEWYSIIDFVTVNKKFSNKKIIGRNHLIFALAQSNVIKKNFKLNEKKLLEFIEKNNELK